MRRASNNLGTLHFGGTEDRRFRSCFGIGAHVCAIAWRMMKDEAILPPEAQFCHYLWALMFMKMYPENETEMCSLLGGVDAKTMRKHVWPMIGSVYELNYSVLSLLTSLFAMCQIQLFSHLFLLSHCQIFWENRKRGNVGNDCLVSDDGTDLPLAKSYMKELWSYKFKYSALRYEVPLCIKT